MRGIRLATFNLENLDDADEEAALFARRLEIMGPQLARLDADVLCLQEVHGQLVDGRRELRALRRLLAVAGYDDDVAIASTVTTDGDPYAERNLVIVSRLPLSDVDQHRHERAPAPAYRRVTARPADTEAREVTWERPILTATVTLPDGRPLRLLDLHLKSRIPTPIPGQLEGRYTWRSAAGWAEGSFLSAMKRLGQALEARILVDELFDADPQALIAVCGDLNGAADDPEVLALRGDTEDTENPALVGRVLVPAARATADSIRHTLYHHGRGQEFDHVLVSRRLLAAVRRVEIHNELLHDESVAFATDERFPESDHAPVVVTLHVPA